MRSEEKAIIIAVVLVAILVVGAAAFTFIFFSPFNFINRVTTRPAPIVVTGLILHILYPSSASNGYFGPAMRILKTPSFMYLQHSEHFLVNFTLTLAVNAVAHNVDSITFRSSPGFTLLSASPNPPVRIQPGSSVSFTVTCQAPNRDFTGPAILDIVTQ